MGIKIWAYVLIITLLLGGAWTTYNKIYDAGYSKAVNEYQGQALVLADKRVAEARRQWDLGAEAASVQIVVEEKIVEKISYVEKEIPTVIEAIKYECRDLGYDIMEVYNNIIEASSDEGPGESKEREHIPR